MKKVVRKTITDQIYEILREEIIEQNIKSGTKLQLKELQEIYNVSSSPLREAMNRLYQDGLVTYFSNKGAEVISFTERDINEIYDLYSELDSIAVRYAMESETSDEMLNELEKNLNEIERYLDEGDKDEFNRLSDEFHLIIYRYADNNRLSKMASQLRGQFTILSNQFEGVVENRQVTYENHRNILDSMAKNDITGAVEFHKLNLSRSKMFVLDRFREME